MIHAAVQPFRIVRAEGLRDRDAEARAEAQAQPDDQEVDGARRADGRQLVSAQELAHDGRIHKTVKLLKQDAEEQRGREAQHQFHRLALR